MSSPDGHARVDEMRAHAMATEDMQGKATTASRVIALEREVQRLREDVHRYTEHCIKLMKANTKLAILVQEHGIDTRPAAAELN